MKMTLEKKMQILKESVAFAEGGCMDCLYYVPQDKEYNDNREYWERSFRSRKISAFSPTNSMLEGLIHAIETIGLSTSEVDAHTARHKIVEGGEGTQLHEGRLGGCVDVHDFLQCIKSLLESKM